MAMDARSFRIASYHSVFTHGFFTGISSLALPKGSPSSEN